MGSGSATGKKFQVRLVHSLLKYFLKFQLWYWIKNLHYQIFKFVIDNSDISLNCLQHIQKRRNFDAKVTCHQPICLLLHAILSGVGVALSVYLVCYFLVPHTHVLCMGSGSATGKKIQVRLVHSLLKYFFKFQLWYWIKNLHYQIFKFVIDNSDISLNCLQHIQKRRNFDAKVTCHQPICLLLHAILSGVGVAAVLHTYTVCGQYSVLTTYGT